MPTVPEASLEDLLLFMQTSLYELRWRPLQKWCVTTLNGGTTIAYGPDIPSAIRAAHDKVGRLKQRFR